MSRSCEVCGRKPSVGNQITRSGSPKYKGGIGLHTGGISKRRFYPNVQKIKVLLDGKVQRIVVCTRCIKAGKIQRPPVRANQIARSADKAEARRQADLAAAAALAAVAAQTEREQREAEAAEAAEAAAQAAREAARATDGKGRGRGRDEETVSYADMDLEEPTSRPKPPRRDDDDKPKKRDKKRRKE